LRCTTEREKRVLFKRLLAYVSVSVSLQADWAARQPGGPVGPPAMWAVKSNVKGGSGNEEGSQMSAEDAFIYTALKRLAY